MKDLPEKNKGIPKSENMPALDKETMAEIEKMAGDQSYALAVLAKGTADTADNTEDLADTLSDIKDCLVKVMQHFSVPLPKRIQAEITAGEYDPDEEPGEEEDEEGDDDEGE